MADQAIIETEETLIIETPERVPLAFALASIGNRFLAVAIDHFIQFLTMFVVAWGFVYWSCSATARPAPSCSRAFIRSTPASAQ